MLTAFRYGTFKQAQEIQHGNGIRFNINGEKIVIGGNPYQMKEMNAVTKIIFGADQLGVQANFYLNDALDVVGRSTFNIHTKGDELYSFLVF